MMTEKNHFLNNVLPNGTRVQCVTVDSHGYCGRDWPPTAGDVGFEGFIVDVFIEVYYEDGQCRAYSRGETVAVPSNEVVEFGACYTVERPSDGKVLELMDHEIEPVPEDTLAAREFALKIIELNLSNCLEAMEDLVDGNARFLSANTNKLMNALESACNHVNQMKENK